MRMVSFREWLATRSQEPSQADRLATLIAQAGAAGVSLADLRRLCGLPPETLQDILRALTATGQVVILKVNGELRYRVA
jgi:lambda repressor-like predicted transcriptional regulator